MTKTAQDAAYITVGLGVIAFQKAQVLRNDLTKSVVADRTKVQTDAIARATELRTELRSELSKLVAKFEETLEPVAKEIGTRAKDAQAQVRALLPV